MSTNRLAPPRTDSSATFDHIVRRNTLPQPPPALYPNSLRFIALGCVAQAVLFRCMPAAPRCRKLPVGEPTGTAFAFVWFGFKGPCFGGYCDEAHVVRNSSGIGGTDNRLRRLHDVRHGWQRVLQDEHYTADLRLRERRVRCVVLFASIRRRERLAIESAERGREDQDQQSRGHARCESIPQQLRRFWEIRQGQWKQRARRLEQRAQQRPGQERGEIEERERRQ